MKYLLYLIGVPGVGKSTLMRAALGDNIPAYPQHQDGVSFIQYSGGVQLGAERERFSGTDAMPMNVQPKVIDWLAAQRPAAVVAEGDRLGNDKFFRAVCDTGYHLTIAWLACLPEIAAQRRWQRGSTQSESWLRGRETKVARLVENWRAHCLHLHAELPVPILAQELRQHPVFQMIRGDTSE